MLRMFSSIAAAAVVFGCSRGGPPPGTVSGTVRDPAGKPIPAVWIAREGFRDGSGVTPWWRTDSDGHFRIDGLPQGEVVLRVIPGEASLLGGSLVRTAAGRAEVPIVIDPGSQLLARIEGYQGPRGDPGHAQLTWRETDGRRPVRYCPIAPDGRVRFVHLPANGSFELWAGAGPGLPVRAAGLRAGDTEIEVTATAARTVAGRVLFREGEDARRVGVIAEAYPGFPVRRTSVDPDGTFVIDGLPEGAFVVHAAFTSGEIGVSTKVEVEAGAKGVILDLRR